MLVIRCKITKISLTACLLSFVIGPIKDEQDRGRTGGNDDGEHSVLRNCKIQLVRSLLRKEEARLTPHRQLSFPLSTCKADTILGEMAKLMT